MVTEVDAIVEAHQESVGVPRHSSADIVCDMGDTQFPNNLSSFATSAVKTHSEGPI